MTLFDMMGLLSTISLTLPILLLLTTYLAWYKCFPALLGYFILLLSYNIISLGYINVSPVLIHYHGLINNLLDAPLILCFLTYFSQTAAFRKSLLVCLGVFLVFELVILLIFGLTKTSNIIILAPGLLIVLAVSAIFFVHYVKLALVNQKAVGKLLMIASMLMSYVVYSFLYVVLYMIDSKFIDDTKLIFFLVTVFSPIVFSIGLMMEKRRVRYLSELNRTREELKAIYGDNEKNTAIPFETAVFKFEKGSSY